MRRTQAPYDDTWAVAHIREVWEWAVAQDRHFVAYLLGMAKTKGKVKILLDIDRVLANKDSIELEAVAARVAEEGGRR